MGTGFSGAQNPFEKVMLHGVKYAEVRRAHVLARQVSTSAWKAGATDDTLDRGTRMAKNVRHSVGRKH